MASNGLLSINESGLKNAKGILDNAKTNLTNARNQLIGITAPEKFSNSARLKTISSSIQKVEKQVSGIQSYIDQKIKDFRRAEENAKNVANALGKSLAGLTTTTPSIVGSLSLQGKTTNAVKPNKIPANMMNSPEYEYYMSTQGKTTTNKTSNLFPFSDASLEQKYADTMAKEREGNIILGAIVGATRAGETMADSYAIGQSNSISKNNPDWNYFTGGDANKIDQYARPYKQETMKRVSENKTYSMYGINKEKYGTGAKIAEDIVYKGTLMALGANPYGVGFLGYMSGKGKGAEEYWSQPEVQKQIKQGKNIDEIYNTGNKYGNVKGSIQSLSMAFQKSTGAGGKVDYVLNKAWKRVLADSAAGGAEVYANAYAESVRTGKSYSEAFKDIGGHEAVAKSAATSGAVSAIGELVRWGLGKNKVQNSNTTVNIPDNETGTAEVKYRIIPENDLTEGFNEQNHTLEVAKSMQRQYWKGYVSDEEIDNGFKKIHVYRDDDFEELEIIKKNPRVSAFCDDNGEVHIKESEVEKCPTSVLHENNHQNGTLKCDPDDVTINRAKDEAATEMFALDAVGDHSNGNSSYAHNVGILRRIKKNVDEKVHSIPGYEETDLLKLAYTDKNNASKDLFDQALDEIMEKEGFSKELNKNLEIGDGGYYYQYSFKEILDASKKLLDMAAEVEMKCSNIK